MQSTFETMLQIGSSDLAVVMVQAHRLSVLERRVFADLYVRKLDLNTVKRRYVAEEGITARQFNALQRALGGKVAAWEEAERRTIETLAGKRASAVRKVKTFQADRGKVRSADTRRRLAFQIHQKKRRIGNLEHRIGLHQKRLAGTPSICFGSRELFREQFNLEANGFESHGQWLEAWRAKRSSQFLNIGSRGETLGSQTCQFDPVAKTLSIRLCREATAANGGKDRLVVGGVTFPYGQKAIDAAQQRGCAVATRIVLRERKGAIAAYALTSVEELSAPVVTRRLNGALGVDLNARSVAVAWVKPDGNIERTDSLAFDLGRLSSDQSMSMLSNLAQDVVMRARASKIPIVRERLDFSEKKKTLGESGPRYAEMLSGFAYASFYELLSRCAERHGVEIITVNPAFTSVMGWVKFGVGRLTVDEAAAAAIARRGMGCTERLRSRNMSPALRTKLMQVAGERHMRHVWSGWRRFAPWLGRSRRTWAGRCSAKEGSADEKSGHHFDPCF